MPVVRVKQVELEVLRSPMADFLTVDRHPERRLPRGRCRRHHESRNVRRDAHPLSLPTDIALQVQPDVERHFDGIPGAAGLQPAQRVLTEERAVHAKTDLSALADQRRDLGPHFPRKRQPSLSVMHIARAVLHPEQMRRLSHMRRDRVVAGNLALMRIEAAEGTRDLQTGRDHYAIDVDRQRAQAQPRQHVRDHRGIKRLQPPDGLHGELRQPATYGAPPRAAGSLCNPQERWNSGWFRIYVRWRRRRPPITSRPISRRTIATRPKSVHTQRYSNT